MNPTSPAALGPNAAGKRFRAIDRILDKAAFGPDWLRDTRIAQCVADALRYGQWQLKIYELHAWVVMPNHVHVLLRPRVPLARITRAIKGFTARQANGILAAPGGGFGRTSRLTTGCATPRSSLASLRILSSIQ